MHVSTARPGLRAAAGPLARATLVALVGAAVLVLVAGVLASTAGLLFVAGVTGAGIGLSLARAAVTAPTSPVEEPPLSRRAVVRLSMLVACLGVALAAVATWLVALAEGGALNLVEYLWTTFGPLVPAEFAVAAVAAAWGARTGPVTAR